MYKCESQKWDLEYEVRLRDREVIKMKEKKKKKILERFVNYFSNTPIFHHNFTSIVP